MPSLGKKFSTFQTFVSNLWWQYISIIYVYSMEWLIYANLCKCNQVRQVFLDAKLICIMSCIINIEKVGLVGGWVGISLMQRIKVHASAIYSLIWWKCILYRYQIRCPLHLRSYSCAQIYSTPSRFPIDFNSKQVVQDWVLC